MTATEDLIAPLNRLKQKMQNLPKWQRRATLVFLGILAALALPPFHLVLMLVPAFVGLLWLLETATGKKSVFFTGWWFGIGHAAMGLYWVHESFLVDAARFAWLIPLAIGSMSVAMGIFPALASLLLRLAKPGPLTMTSLFAFSLGWVLTEWLRSWILTGFPWNLLGTVWVFSDQVIQSAAFIGTFGLSLITVFIAGSFAFVGQRAGKAGYGLPVVSLLVLGGLWLAGDMRLNADKPADIDGVRLRIVQPNIPQHLKWVQELRAEHFKTLLQLSATIARPDSDNRPYQPVTHVIWPETATPFFLSRSPDAQTAIGSITPKGGFTITGSPRTVTDPNLPFQVWNSIHALNDRGQITHTYDKFHLVPFGEYVPYRFALGFLGKLTEGRTDFTPGPGPQTWNLPGLPPASPLICYEIIFPGAVTNTADRPGWLLNLTNDAWFGTSSGPHQHLAAARMRAVEEGLPVVRAANTGISAVINAYGQVISQLDLEVKGVIDSQLPGALEKQTLYSRLHQFVVVLIIALYSLIIIACKNKSE